MKLLFSRLEEYNSLKVKTYDADSIVTTVLGRLCWEYRLINMDSAIYYCDEALRISERIKYIRGIGLTYHQSASVYRQKGELTKALNFHYKALAIWRSFQKTNPGYYYGAVIFDEARTLNNMGIIYEQLGEYIKALDLYLKGLAIDEQRGNKNGAANKLGNIGNLYLKQNDYDKALRYYFQVLSMGEASPNKERTAECYGNIGFAYWKKAYRDSAIEYYQKAIAINENTGNKKLWSENLGNISLIYEEEKDYTSALEYANKSLALKKDIDDKSGIAAVLGNIGSMFLDQNIFIEAEKNLLEAKNIADSIGEKRIQLDQYLNLCSLYTKKGDYKKALEYQQKAVSIKDSLFNQKQTEEITTMTLSYKFGREQDSTKAANEKQKAIDDARSKFAIAEANNKRLLAESQQKIQVANAENKRIAAEADKEKAETEAVKKIAVSEADKKRAEAEAAQKIAVSKADLEKQKLIRNSIIGGSGALALIGFLGFINFRNKRRREKAELSQQVSETEMKALRAQMNPHFLFNALGSIQSFLLNNKSSDANNYLLKFKELVRLVLENSSYKEVSIAEDMKALELYMQLESIRLQHPFSYQFRIDKNIDTEQAVIPPLILQPFVENAIWHGLQPKDDGGHIDISIKQAGGNLQCIVEDNGVGRNNKQMQTTSPFKKESLGIKLTEERLKIINELKKVKAYFNITDLFSANNKPCGTRVELMLPLL